MTNPNKYNPYPDAHSISCPKCGGEAEYRASFTLCNEKQFKEIWEKKLWPRYKIVKWGGYIVIQHAPFVHAWKIPASYHSKSDIGLVRCMTCISTKEHRLDWPKDAHYRIKIGKDVLWAWTKEHAEKLLEYIESNERNKSRNSAHFLFLLHVPKIFQLKKNREIVSNRLRKILDVR